MKKEQRYFNLCAIKALEELDIDKAIELINSEFDEKEYSFLIQDSLSLPDNHPLKISKDLIFLGIKNILKRMIKEQENTLPLHQ